MRSFLGDTESELLVVTSLSTFSGCGDGSLTILPAPGRSDRPVLGCTCGAAFCGELVFGARVGMLDEGLLVMTTSLGLLLLLLGLGSAVP